MKLRLESNRFVKFACSFLFTIILFTSLNGQDSRMQYFPANEIHYSGLHTYSVETGDIQQYYVSENVWVKNDNMGQPDISITTGNIRMEFFPGDTNALPGLFVYSTRTGEFESFYLKDNEWILNDNYPKGKSSISSKELRIDFTPATLNALAYITAYSTDGSEFEMLYVKDGKWINNELFPSNSKFFSK